MSANQDNSKLIIELSELAGGLAHEIRNPLSTLKVNLQLLSEDLQDAGENDYIDQDLQRRSLQRLQTLHSEADRLEHLLDNFLKLVGTQEFETHHADVNDLLAQLVDFFQPTAESQAIQLRVALSEPPLICALDAAALKQAFLNILINAQQAMPQGGELIIATSKVGDHAHIEMTDTGMGISPDLLPRVFAPFFSTKKEGSGLGLPLTRRIIDEHHGDIEVNSELGKGTRFTVRLPLVETAQR